MYSSCPTTTDHIHVGVPYVTPSSRNGEICRSSDSTILRNSSFDHELIAYSPCLSAAECTAFSFQSAKTTEAPDSAKALAVARPNPDAAPVTSATLFSKDMFITSASLFERVVSRFLVDVRRVLKNVRFVHLLRPVLRFDFLKRNGK